LTFATIFCINERVDKKEHMDRILSTIELCKRVLSTKELSIQGSKLTYVRQSVTDKNPGKHIDFFTYQSDLAHSD
jgi:hypothetical protein